MTHTLTHAGRWARLRASLLALAVLAGGCDSAEQLATTEPGADVDGAALAPADSTASASTDAISADLASMDVVSVFDPTVASASATTASTAYGPTDLYTSWTDPAVPGFSGAILYASPSGIVKLLNAMKANNHRAFLKMTGEPQWTYMTNGRFDYYKWARATSRYNTSTIRNAVAAAVSNGTLLGYSMIDEPNRFNWNGSINKAMVDRMARHSRSIFPTLPTAAVVTYYWRPTERYRNLDVIISQTWKPKKTAATFAREAVAAAKLNGTAIAFSLNLRAGPSGGTMTPTQIRDWAKTLGRASCAMFMWRYSSSLFSQTAYKSAFRDVAYTLAREPAPRCRRGALN